MRLATVQSKSSFLKPISIYISLKFSYLKSIVRAMIRFHVRTRETKIVDKKGSRRSDFKNIRNAYTIPRHAHLHSTRQICNFKIPDHVSQRFLITSAQKISESCTALIYTKKSNFSLFVFRRRREGRVSEEIKQNMLSRLIYSDCPIIYYHHCHTSTFIYSYVLYTPPPNEFTK